MATLTIQIGDVLVGFCGGFFGRDSYLDKRVEARGKDWVVTRNCKGEPEFASSEDETIDSALAEYIQKIPS